MIINPIISLWIMIPISIFLGLMIYINSNGLKMILRFVFLVLLFVINLRIMINNGKSLVFENNLDIIFIVDTTISMDAVDVKPTRLTQVKKDINYIMDKTIGANYSVIAYDNSVYVSTPLTKDSTMVSSVVDSLSVPQELYAKGSKITVFENSLEELLAREKNKKDRAVIVYIFSDGENNTNKSEETLTGYKKQIQGGAVLGYGTTKGGGMMVEDYDGVKKYLTYYDDNYNKKNAISKIDEKNLKNIANELGIEYIHMTETSKINNNLKKLNKIKVNANNGEKYSYSDTYYFITPFLAVLLLIELYDYRKVEL